MENSKPIVIVIVAVLILGVALVFVLQRQGTEPELAAESIATEESVISVGVEATPTTAVEATAAPTVAEAEATEMIVPTERAGLEATDPATVMLASGQLQLIEAFAFW